MNTIKRYWVLAFILGIITYNLEFLYAQEVTIETYLPKKSTEECLNNFDINSVDFKDPKVIPYIPLLAEYFQCQAAVRDNIKECDNLNPWPDAVRNCRVSFNEYHGFLGRLFMVGSVTPQILTACTESTGLTREKCSSFSQACLKGEVSFCDRSRDDMQKFNECRAIISGDSKLCFATNCANKASYIKAVKTGDIKECEGIKGPTFEKVKTMCQGYISGDGKICEKNKGFEEFRNKYCK